MYIKFFYLNLNINIKFHLLKKLKSKYLTCAI